MTLMDTYVFAVRNFLVNCNGYTLNFVRCRHSTWKQRLALYAYSESKPTKTNCMFVLLSILR